MLINETCVADLLVLKTLVHISTGGAVPLVASPTQAEVTSHQIYTVTCFGYKNVTAHLVIWYGVAQHEQLNYYKYLRLKF